MQTFTCRLKRCAFPVLQSLGRCAVSSKARQRGPIEPANFDYQRTLLNKSGHRQDESRSSSTGERGPSTSDISNIFEDLHPSLSSPVKGYEHGRGRGLSDQDNERTSDLVHKRPGLARYVGSAKRSRDEPVQGSVSLASRRGSGHPEKSRPRRVPGSRSKRLDGRSSRGDPEKPPIIALRTNNGVMRPLISSDNSGPFLLKVIEERFDVLRRELRHQSATEKGALEGWGINSSEELEYWADKFSTKLEQAFEAGERPITSRKEAEDENLVLWDKLREAFKTRDIRGLHSQLRYSFASFVFGSSFSSVDVTNQKSLADLRYPLEWFPATRALQRKIHLHVGPTNSGKTYQALKKLEAAESGIYAGPLRLLAHEVYTRLNAGGKPCTLITGEEHRLPGGRINIDFQREKEITMTSCTVEMVPLNSDVDVAVIDEIQMIGDTERGWAWTQAFLGVKAKELHLCGEARTVPLVEDLCKMMGDSLEVHSYERLSPLKAMDRSLKGDLKQLEKGDCIIVFSRVGIHAMKLEVEKATGKRCAVVYGSLPPETRAQQASLFNDPDNDYDFLVASDAVGMGLNLSIKRVIFEATSKHDGTSFRTIRTSELKQIGGRAGRYRTATQAIQDNRAENAAVSSAQDRAQSNLGKKETGNTVGMVTALEDFDMPIIKRAMSTEVEPLASAGIFPPSSIVARFAAYFPANTPFSYILLRLHELSIINPRFHLCQFKDQLAIADVIQPYNLSVTDRIILIAAPVTLKDEGMEPVTRAFAKCIASQTGGELVDIKAIDLELLDADGSGKNYLKSLEALHKQLTLYLWLSYRFHGVFRSQQLAFHVKALLEAKIDKVLGKVELTSTYKKQLHAARQRAAKLSQIPPHQIVDIDIEDDTKENGQYGTLDRSRNEGVESNLDESRTLPEAPIPA
ncbi:MAG: RNA helicase [Claussenomyces sp. TS43310]|nr:MAG: RNA helicase [Claussenomyces sp. TS43310]